MLQLRLLNLVKCNMLLVDLTRNRFRVLICRSQESTLTYGYLKQNEEQIDRMQRTQVMHRRLETCLGNRQTPHWSIAARSQESWITGPVVRALMLQDPWQPTDTSHTLHHPRPSAAQSPPSPTLLSSCLHS